MLRGEGRAGGGAAKDDIAREEACGGDANQSNRALQGVHGRAPLPDHVRRQRIALDAGERDKEQVGFHRVRPEVLRRHQRCGTITLFSYGQGGEFNGRRFVAFCDASGTQREFTARTSRHKAQQSRARSGEP